MTLKPIIAILLSRALLMLVCAAPAFATVKVSHDDGRWDAIYWSGGMPMPGDTLVIASDVTGLPEMRFAKLAIRPWGRLRIEEREPEADGLENDGTLMIERSAVLVVMGDLVNRGTIGGEGIVRMGRDGSTISGGGTFGPLAVGSVSGSAIHLGDSLTLPSLSLSRGCRLMLDGHNLTVNGPYSSASAFGEPGIEGESEVLALNGSIYGTARGNVVIGAAPGVVRSKRALPPEVHGVIGDTMGTVRFMASRRIGFSTLIGAVMIDSGATLEASGIGTNGSNLIHGSLTIEGKLTAADEHYRWNIHGDIFNQGTIGPCTIVMSGFRPHIRSDRGVWDPGINLIYIATSASELRLDAPLTLSKLTIAPKSPLDSNIVLDAGPYVLKIRHRFTSDIARGCRIVTDTMVKIWGASEGMVEGSVLFEGFWDYPVAGRYGAAGKEVRFATRKEIVGELAVVGMLTNDPPSPLTISSSAFITGTGRFRGGVIIKPGATLVANGDLTFERGARGGGAIRLIARTPRLDAVRPLSDTLLLEIGRDTAITSVSLLRTLQASRILIQPGSSLSYGTGDSIAVSRDLRIIVKYTSNFNSVAAATINSDPRAGTVFPGNNSVLRYDNGFIAADTIFSGRGYYVRFPAATTVTHTGLPINAPLTIPIQAGWNLIGGPSIPIRTSSITVTGTTLLSGYLSALGGAQSVTILEPGRGYWVNAAGAGTMVMKP